MDWKSVYTLFINVSGYYQVEDHRRNSHHVFATVSYTDLSFNLFLRSLLKQWNAEKVNWQLRQVVMKRLTRVFLCAVVSTDHLQLGHKYIENVSHIRYLVALAVKKIDNSHDLINISSFLEYISRTLFHSRKGNIRRQFRSNQGSNFHFFSISILTRFEIPSDQGSPISCDAWFWGIYSYGHGVHFKVIKLQF